jgi:hypothetical protein
MVAFTSLASPLAAQHAGTVEFGALGRASFFDPTLGLQDYLGVGGRFAVFIVRNLAIEGDASYIQTNIAPAGRVTKRTERVYPRRERLGQRGGRTLRSPYSSERGGLTAG